MGFAVQKLIFVLSFISICFGFSKRDSAKIPPKEQGKIHEIKLPPHPGTDKDKTVEGVDVNNNHVRDDVEIYIFDGILKRKPEIYKAYFNVAETISLEFKNRFNREKLLKLEDIYDRDRLCVNAVDENDDPETSLKLLVKKLHDTKLRKEADNQIGSTLFTRGPRGKHPPRETWSSLCRK